MTTPVTPGHPDRFKNTLAACIIIAFVGTLPFLIFKTIPTENEQLITYIIGQISGMATTVLGAYFVNNMTNTALDSKRAENTAKALDAVTAAIGATPPADGLSPAP